MYTKTYGQTGRVCRVTFHLNAEMKARTVSLCGDFNEWDPECNFMERSSDGSFSTSVMLHPGHQYRFRYLIDGQRWEVDGQAEGYALNRLGGDDAVIMV